MTRLSRIAHRRAALAAECALARADFGAAFARVRTGATLALLAWAGARLLAKRSWWQAAAFALTCIKGMGAARR
ncbi:hypothetical protein [Caenimonas aquaedulcis]|uniref:Uncharacterized protein n=1 Tax=Caenimonas aquaedulcis TaxID=2793270 RepID=A0A931H7T7_9BURK|nr:hypothetical protein [Caenimonas aquaedulcis]MBG9390206.1 hypothetical protein [Caenimonas aquaedulcis]